jgi:hypothetical protein
VGAIDLGTGSLNWHADERRTDRYGTVHLNRDLDSADYDPVLFDGAPVGEAGQLVAVMISTGRSFHAGDWARGFEASPSEVGDEIVLGSGTLFVEDLGRGDTEIGLRPDDGRDHDWLDPKSLYQCHNQTVRLEFRPGTRR